MIKIYEPDIIKYKNSAIDAINSGWISNQGIYIEKATNKLNEILKTKYSILMANGTCATHCLFLSLKYKYPEIKKIYMPNNVYIAAWNCALMEYSMENLELMRMDEKTWNICINEDYIKTLDANSAVFIVHNLGNIVNVSRLKSLRPDLIFIEDNCEGLFGKYNGRFSGTGDDCLCSSVSFYGNKSITTGEGGAFITNDEEVYNYIKKIYSQGMSNTRYLHEVHAYNYRMTNIQAAFLYDQLNDIENILENKRRVFSNYEKLLSPLILNNAEAFLDAEALEVFCGRSNDSEAKLDGKVSIYQREQNTISADWIFSVRIIGNKKTIDETTRFFYDNGVDIRPFFYPMNSHKHLAFLENKDEVSYLLNNEVIMIPSSPTITEEDQRKVVDVIYRFIFANYGIRVIDLQIEKKSYEILDEFIPIINSKYFRYFDKRKSDCIKNHILTFLFYDINCNKYFGYTHIDFYEKYWFGIYLDENYRGKKIGNLLLNYTLNHHKLINIKEINLSVDIDNERAIKLYKKNGFKIYNQTDSVYYMKI